MATANTQTATPSKRVTSDGANNDTRSLTAVNKPGHIALNSDGQRGMTHLSLEVLAKMASLIIRDVDGVHALAPVGASQRLSKFARSFSDDSDLPRDFGVNVEIGTVEAAIDCRVVVDYGASIPTVARDIRSALVEGIEPQTGLTLKEINVDVVDLWFEDSGANGSKKAGEVRELK